MTKNEKKYRFNIIDVLIILVVIAIGVVMYYYMSARNTVASNSEVELEYVVELKTVHKDYLDNIKIGDKAVETVREQQIGEIVDIAISPAYNIATNTETGEMYIAYYPPLDENGDTIVLDGEENNQPIEGREYEYYNVRVTVRDTFKRSESGYKINAFELVVGQVVYFRVPEFIGEGYCLSIKEIDKEEAAA